MMLCSERHRHTQKKELHKEMHSFLLGEGEEVKNLCHTRV